MALASRELRSPLAHLGGESVGQRVEPVAEVERLDRRREIGTRQVGAREAEIRRNRALEEEWLLRHHGEAATQSLLTFFPQNDGAFLPLITLAVFLAVQWWAAVYPGAEPGGGGYVAQRMFASKDEKSSLLAVLTFMGTAFVTAHLVRALGGH